jgi:hypothetical protein
MEPARMLDVAVGIDFEVAKLEMLYAVEVEAVF